MSTTLQFTDVTYGKCRGGKEAAVRQGYVLSYFHPSVIWDLSKSLASTLRGNWLQLFGFFNEGPGKCRLMAGRGHTHPHQLLRRVQDLTTCGSTSIVLC